MKSKLQSINNLPVRLAVAVSLMLLVLSSVQLGHAASWKGIVPLKSSREDVEKVLGAPIKAQDGNYGPLQFKVPEGTVTVGFASPIYVEKKGLSKSYVGRILQIVFKPEGSAETPVSLKLNEDKDFVREEQSGVIVYKNEKDGIVHTFINGQLKTSYYVPALSQLSTGGKYWLF